MKMKRIGYGVLLTFLGLLLSGLVEAQKPSEHEKRIYRSPEGKLYIQKEMPVYLRISTSPDEESESYLLKSEESAEYTNPMYFDTDGWNTIRSPWAVDTSTKEPVYPQQEALFEVYADSEAPETKLEVSDAQAYMNEGERYYGQEIQIELSAEDDLSGTEEIYYSLNGDSYEPYETPIGFSEEKHYVVKYYAIDHVRNVESPDSLDFHLDMSAPETRYSIEGNTKDNILGQDVKIKLESEDSLSGVKEIRYSINEGEEKIYTGPIPVSKFQQEDNELVFYAVDHVNNKEEKQSLTSSVNQSSSESEDGGEEGSFSYYMDEEPPEVDMEIVGDSYEGKKNLFVSSRSKVKIIAEDEKSGVKSISYSINNSDLDNEYEEPFKFDIEDMGYLNYAAEDEVGNQSDRKTTAIYNDTGLPESSVSYDGLNYENRDTLFVKPDTRFVMNGEDSESGLKEIRYHIDDEQAETYSEPVTIEDPGFHNLEFYAVDRVNNQEEASELKVYVDNEAPHIYPRFSVEPIGTKVVRGEKYEIYPSNAKLYIGATDKACGTDYITYKINGGDAESELPIKQFDPGNYSVEIYAYDHLNNKSVKTIKFAIEH
ncbi:MAG: OmpL47-type beta-barrel domain-containing protein [Bacteroidales bacterium]